MRIGHLGPAGTFTEEGARGATAGLDVELVALPSVPDTLQAVLDGDVEVVLVPIENSLEGSVTATVDALSAEPRLAIVGETVLPIRHCLVAREELALPTLRSVRSHPQAIAQCMRFLRTELPGAELVATGSTAEAVRSLADAPPATAAIASRAAAEMHGARVLREGIEDEPDNATRFAWIATAGSAPFPPGPDHGPWKTSVLFAGAGDASPGWLVRCLSEFAFRGVNLVRIESRPARRRLGHYLFLTDCEGRADERPVADALLALDAHCDQVRVLGSYRAAPGPPVH